ncbi:MAG: hypothetical protein IMZ50_04470 [Candidatus Atribacteria bacterium]|nr:hypothetical protein [Candidatus Atribacteria bacterium]MBE3123451.1 hypothetical protein [Planctomycetota bacterium]
MGLIIRVLLLTGLVKLLLVTDNAPLCAGIYALFGFGLRLMLGVPWVPATIAAAVSFGLAWLYFWLLHRFQEGLWFWLIMIAGLALGIV